MDDEAGAGFDREALDAYSRVVISVSEKLVPSIAHLRSARGSGSGVAISHDGFIVTSAHVVARAPRLRASFADGSEFRAEVVGSDPLSDLAVVRAEAEPESGDRGVDPDHVTVAVGERPARVARVEGGVGLDDVLDDPSRCP
jgi:S1-C subfamily serine protease